MAIKTYKPTTPSRRQMTVTDYSVLSKVEPEKSLLEPMKKKSGRNSYGRITVRHRGGGNRRKYRVIDFKRDKDNMIATVLTLEYDPNRSAFIALVQYEDGEKRYIIAPNGLKVGDKVLMSKYSGTKTNHLRLYTSPGNYDGWEEIPFQCVVTASDGTVRHTDNIYMYIYPTDKLIPNMKNWGYGLYTPSITNAIDLYTKDDVNYTASTCAGTNLKIICGSKPVDDKPILRKSEVALTTEIHITENGKTTVSGNYTSNIPYTVGKTQVQIKEKLTIGGHDLGYFDAKTIDITVAKPQVIGTGTAKSDCSLLRYTYNESQKLTTIPKGTSLEIVGEEGGYYQVYYNGYVGYVGKTLLNFGATATGKLITNVDVTIPKPVAGQTPAGTCTIHTTGCELYKTDPVTWTDASGKFMKSTDKFQEGQKYTVSIS